MDDNKKFILAVGIIAIIGILIVMMGQFALAETNESQEINKNFTVVDKMVENESYWISYKFNDNKVIVEDVSKGAYNHVQKGNNYTGSFHQSSEGDLSLRNIYVNGTHVILT